MYLRNSSLHWIICIWLLGHHALDAQELTTLAEIQAFQAAGGEDSCDASVTATVNFWDPVWHSLFVQDGEAATYVGLPYQLCSELNSLRLGSRIRIDGRYSIERGHIFAERVSIVGQDLPTQAQDIVLDELALGDHWSRRVRLTGVVESALFSNSKCQLVMQSGETRFLARILDSSAVKDRATIVGASVQLTGTAVYLVDEFRGPETFLCQSMPDDSFTILTPGKAATSAAIKMKSVAELTAALATDGTRETEFEISGQVAFVHEYDFFILEDSQRDTIAVYGPYEGDLELGNVVRVIARGKKQGEFSNGTPPALSRGEDTGGLAADVIAKRVIFEYASMLPPARPITAKEIVHQDAHHQRITTTGSITSVGSIGFIRSLHLEHEGIAYTATFWADDASYAALNLPDASSVRITGLVEQTSHSRHAQDAAFMVQLEAPDNVTVVQRRASVERQTVWLLVGGFLSLLGCGAIVMWRLRSRVDDQERNLARALAHLDSSYDAIREAVLVVDQGDNIVGMNANIEKILGTEMAHWIEAGSVESEPRDTLFKRISDCFSDSDKFVAAWRDVHNDPTRSLTVELTTRDQPPRTLVVYTAPITNDQGNSEDRIWTFDDVSKRKQLEANLLQSQKMDAVGRLAGGVAHDFNNLLLAMIVNIELARMQYANEGKSVDEHLDAADAAAQRAAELVKHLLGFSRKANLRMLVCQLNHVVSQVGNLLQRTLDARIKLDVEEGKNLWHAKVDSTQLEQVLLNICLNARDAVQDRTGTIQISTVNVPAVVSPLRTAAVRIRIEDDGIGMPQHILDKIYEPFFTTKEAGKGTGLGLAMSFGIVEQHGGTIQCKSEPGKGTQFDVFLPRSNEPYQTQIDAPAPAPQDAPTGRILIADDETLIRDSVSQSLQFHGLEVFVVKNGREALESLASRNDIDAVLLDLSMPEMSGSEAFLEIRKSHPQLPVIICSGYLHKLEEFQHDTQIQPFATIAKPFQTTELLDIIQDALTERRALVPATPNDSLAELATPITAKPR